MRVALITLALLLSAAAMAECTDANEVFSCRVGQNALQVCHEDNTLIYSFGQPGNPDLTLT